MSRRHPYRRNKSPVLKITLLLIPIALAGFLGYRYWHYNPRPNTAKPTYSLVLFLRQPLALDSKALTPLVYNAWGNEIAFDPADIENAQTDHAVAFRFVAAGRYYAVNVGSSNYFENPDAEAAKRDALLATVIREHTGWVSVDLVEKDEKIPAADAYRLVALLLAQLANQDAGAIFAPKLDRMNLASKDLAEILRSDTPLRAVSLDESVEIKEDDPKLKSAEAEARRRLPEFTSAYKTRSANQIFQIKAPFVEGADTEYLWLTVTAMTDTTLQGRLEDQPQLLAKLHKGDPVTINVTSVSDWLYTKDDETVGDFTSAALKPR